MSPTSRALLNVLAFGLVLAATSGCYNATWHASPGAHVDTKVSGDAGQPFTIERGNNYYLWGNFPRMRYFAVDRMVSEQLGIEARNISGLKITQRQTFWKGLIEVFTLGLWTPRTLVIEGTVHDQAPGATARPAATP